MLTAKRPRRARRSRPRALTVSLKSIARGDEKLRISTTDPEQVDASRPHVRGECVDSERPCPFVGCRYHLYLDVNAETGSIKLNYPELEPDEMTESCVLDVADRGEHTLEATGLLLNLTRERVRQIEVKAYAAANVAPTMVELRSA